MRRILVVGGSGGAWEEVGAAMLLADYHSVVAVNHAGRDFPGALDHWASYHPSLLPGWVRAREVAGLPACSCLWTAIYRGNPLGRGVALPLRRVASWGGSSGLLAVRVALEVGADRIVLAGVPMDPDRSHYDRQGRWDDGDKYLEHWREQLPEIAGQVRSMSGWTRELLGPPTRAWLLGEESAC